MVRRKNATTNNSEAILNALAGMEGEHNVPKDVIIDALKEMMARAYKKTVELSDINIEVEFDEATGEILIYQCYEVVEEVEDDELEISLPDAREIKPTAILHDVIKEKKEYDLSMMSRAAAQLGKSVLRQKVREAEKATVYNEYIDKKDEMVMGIVESVKDKQVLVNLGKTTAAMYPRDQIPGEIIREQQKLRVVITEVNKDGKGPQVLVSRASEMLVRRLFEKEVPEISQGIVEIKCIARDAGERTKMAVVSYNPDIDPIGACIGQRGSRVQEIINELHGEKIDIFLYSEDIADLVKNALAPAEVEAVVWDEEENSLLAIVDEKQLSLAIGKKGLNARLAVKLVGKKIDIKTKEELMEAGKDYDALLEKARAHREAFLAQQAKKAAVKESTEEKESEEEKKNAEALAQARKAAKAALEAEGMISEEMSEVWGEHIYEEAPQQPATEEKKEEPVETIVEEAKKEEVQSAPEEDVKAEEIEEPAVEEEMEPEEEAEEEEPAKKEEEKVKVDLEEVAAKNDYVSKFEKLANTSKAKVNPTPAYKKRKKKSEEENTIKTRNDELLKQLKGSKKENKPIYTEEELAEIEKQQEEEEASQYDIDYDEYEDYYSDDK